MNFLVMLVAEEPGSLHFRALADIDADALLLNGCRPSAPVPFGRHSGSEQRDVMGETFARLCLISRKVVEAFRANDISGWSTFPVRLIIEKGELQGYHGLAVTGRSGPIDRSRSQIIERSYRTGRGHHFAEIGAFVDPQGWDGSDIFVPESSSLVCVTEKTKAALSDAAVSGLTLIPNEEVLLMLHSERPER